MAEQYCDLEVNEELYDRFITNMNKTKNKTKTTWIYLINNKPHMYPPHQEYKRRKVEYSFDKSCIICKSYDGFGFHIIVKK